MEKIIFDAINKSMKAAIELAMDDVFKNFKIKWKAAAVLFHAEWLSPFLFYYIAHSPITPSSGTKRRYQNFLGHPFSTPGICGFICLKGYPGCPGNGVRSFVNRKPLKWGCFSSLLEPPPLFMKATVLLDTGSDGFVCMFSRCRKSSEKPRKSDDFLIFIKNFVIIYM